MEDNGVAPSPGHLFEPGNDYKVLHGFAKQKHPEVSLEPDVFAVAILKHDKQPYTGQPNDPNDLLWFKVKAKHSIAKLRNAYLNRTETEVNFRHANSLLSDSTKMKDLNHMNDNIVVFTAHETSMNDSTPQSSASNQSRNPLQPVNTQLQSNHANHLAADIKPLSGTENSYQTPYSSVNSNSNAAGSSKAVGTRSPWPYTLSIKNEDGVESRTSLEGGLAQDEISSRQGFGQYVGWSSRFGTDSSSSVTQPPRSLHSPVKHEDSEGTPMSGMVYSSEDAAPKAAPQNTRLQKLIEEGPPEVLEAEVRRTKLFLETLKKPLVGMTEQHRDASHWLQQIETLQKQQVDTPTIIGVVGNTGAGKSSVINAMLDEERLVPTNCMRACTACVTELSWNSCDNKDAKYRADIEFIQASDWEKDLRISLDELVDGSGNISRDCNNAESEAGVAYAKIKAVYPNKTKEQLASSTIEQLMNEPAVKEVVGTIKKIEKGRPEPFYRALQHYVDSKEKATGDPNRTKEKSEKKQMEFWPLIKVVRIYTKADALSTGAVIVDLPGVHDSNAARANVATSYMKQTTGLWVVAPINRAVDDKAAKSLLGESFKRQLKYDGIYSRVTFICSKTDDISIMEAADSLGLEEEMAADWGKVDRIEKEHRGLSGSLKELKDSKAVYADVMNDADDGVELWEKLKDDLEDGKQVWAPSEASKKRKRVAEPKKARKKTKASKDSEADDDESGDDFIDDDGTEEDNDSEGDNDSDMASKRGDYLTMDAIDEKLSQLREDKKRARSARVDLDAKIKDMIQQIQVLKKSQQKIETKMSAVCISGRNKYSKGAIQQDFAAGIRELDQESAIEEDEASFNPEEDVRDYEEVARSLPVFCCSSRAYQKLCGRLQRDPDVPGFRAVEETEIPQLQAHCKKLTEAGRASNCRRFLTSLSQILNSLGIWACNDGTGLNLSDAQMAAETRFLKLRLNTLEKSLDGSVKDCLQEMNLALAENIFENYDQVVEVAVSEANITAARWHAPVNRDKRALGGYYWATYKAITRRSGVFSNAEGPHDLNLQLTEPIIKHLANHWERVFVRRLPQVLQSFSRKSKGILTTFHREIESRSMKQGAGIAGLLMLGQQLQNYEQIFLTLTQQMIEVINNLQREANREFTPVIADHLSSAYEWCAAESGVGCFKRMKEYMTTHIDSHRANMFTDSCEEVRKRLNHMCRQVEEQMANKADEVFMNMQRDYTEIVTGTSLPKGQVMPKWERQMRAEVAKAIEDEEKAAAERVKFAEEVVTADTTAGNDSNVQDNPAEDTAGRVTSEAAQSEGEGVDGHEDEISGASLSDNEA